MGVPPWWRNKKQGESQRKQPPTPECRGLERSFRGIHPIGRNLALDRVKLVQKKHGKKWGEGVYPIL